MVEKLLKLSYSLRGKRSGVAGTKPSGLRQTGKLITRNYPDNIVSKIFAMLRVLHAPCGYVTTRPGILSQALFLLT